MQNVLRHEGGVLGLFRGLGPTLLREVPGNAAYFGLYDLSKHKLAEWQVRCAAQVLFAVM
jgi:solute carrier family 25 carnitine/acylcarnitine transporter 20/29